MIYLAELSKLVDENFNLFSPAEISRLVQADSVVEGEVKRCIGVVESVINGAVDRL